LVRPGETSAAAQPPFVNAALAALDAVLGTANRADIRVARARSRARAILRGLLQTSTAA
jgi:CRISPR system Cascade subunit CasA